MKTLFTIITLLCFLAKPLTAQNPLELASPDGRALFQFFLDTKSPAYSISYKNQPIIEKAKLGIQFKDFAMVENLKVIRTKYKTKDEYYELIVGKNKTVHNHYRELSILLEDNTSQKYRMYLIVRAYNDGIAFRYEFPKQKNRQSYEMTEEMTTFNMSGNPKVHTLILPSYTTSHEGLYTSTDLEALEADKLMDMPTTFQFSDSLFAAISEANLRDYAGMYLQKNAKGELISRLSPLPGQSEIKVKATLPHRSPWRVIFIGDKIGTLLESNLLTHLNEPCTFKDVSWIKPGKSTWTWWNGDIIKGVNFTVGQNFPSHQYYIDFCAANQIEYHAIIEHGNQSWYQTNGEGFDPPPPGADVTKPVESLEMEKLAAYSREKGVGLRVWVHWKPLSEKLEEAFALYQKWNIKGLMVDFMDRDDQEMVLWQEKVLQTAAKYLLHVQFHGAYKPTGLHRTYPNEFTREGALNLENLKWGKECDPEHNLMIPFTRLIAGATDYHAGGFRAVPRSEYQPQFIEPHVLGTRCHHLALYVVYESYLHLVSDYPQAYENQPGFEFIRQVPTSWDETKILNGEIGNYIVTARRKGNDWYIGVMNDWTPRTLKIKLDFLNPGSYQAEIYQDTEDAESNPNKLKKVSQTLSQGDEITINLAAGGGQVIYLKW